MDLMHLCVLPWKRRKFDEKGTDKTKACGGQTWRANGATRGGQAVTERVVTYSGLPPCSLKRKWCIQGTRGLSSLRAGTMSQLQLKTDLQAQGGLSSDISKQVSNPRSDVKSYILKDIFNSLKKCSCEVKENCKQSHLWARAQVVTCGGDTTQGSSAKRFCVPLLLSA